MNLFSKKINIILSIFIVLSIIIFSLAYQLTNRIIEDSFSKQIQLHYENINKKIHTFKKEKFDLLYTLANTSDIKTFTTLKKDIEIKKLFLAFAKSNKLIVQMRILDLEGNETVRLDKIKDDLLFKKDTELQNKKHRYYFQEFLKLKKNELGISSLDLNIENKIIEKPFKSTVRLAMPIYTNEQKEAILIINYHMNDFIKELLSSSVFNIYLVDKNEYFISHIYDEYNWSEFTPKKTTLSTYFDTNFNNNLVFKDLILWNNFYKIIYENKKSSTLASFLNSSLNIGILIFLGILFLVLPFLYIIVSYIKKLNISNNSLSITKNKLESILNHTSDSIILIDLKGIIKEVNTSTVKIFGYEKDELINKNINILVPEPHHSKHDDYVKNHNKDMKSKIINIDRELFGLHKDGSFVQINLTVTKVRINNLEYFIGTIKNLSDEVKTKKLFENIFNSSSIGIAVVLESGNFWRVNNRFADIVEYSTEELTKLTFQDITHKDDLEKDLALVKKVINKKIENYSIDKRYITKSGKTVWVKLTVKGVFFNENPNKLDYFIVAIDDITEQVNTRIKLIEAEKIAQIGHWFFDIKNNHLIWSENMIKLFGKTKDDFTNDYEAFISTVHEEDREFVNKSVKETFNSKKDFDIEYRIVVNDKIKYIHARGKIKLLDGEAIEFFGTCQNITKLKILEKEKKEKEVLLMEQSKLASMGEMIGSIAHQWRQPLNSIGFIVQDMISAYKHNEFDDKYLNEVKKEVMEQLKYMSDTIDEFRNYFKKDEPYKEFNLLTCILDVYKLYRTQLNTNHLVLNYLVENKEIEELSEEDKNKFTIVNQESQLKQILINCISNAKDAILELKDVKSEQKNILIKVIEKKKSFEIHIEDLAGGVVLKNTSKIFEPYFTTKKMGTGLGLYICKTICEKSLKGKIEYKMNELEIDNINYKGSTFIITIPKTI